MIEVVLRESTLGKRKHLFNNIIVHDIGHVVVGPLGTLNPVISTNIFFTIHFHCLCVYVVPKGQLSV